ncbi:MAG: cupredoxin domain-containing protein [Parvibaculaceae bacterium]
MLRLHGAPARALILLVGGLSLVFFANHTAEAKDPVTYEMTLKGQTFMPAELKVPAGTSFVIRLKNENDAPAEFESKEMKFEKVVAGHSEILTRVKALPGGIFEFYDEYHEDEARGTVVSE